MTKYTYTYDNLDRVLTIDNNGTTDMPRVIETYTYDSFGNRQTLSTSVNGTADATSTYGYDKLNRLTQIIQSGTGVATKRVNYDYDSGGRQSAIRRYSDSGGTIEVATTTYGYDSSDRVISLTHTKGATTLASYAFTYDALGRLSGQTDAEGSANFAFDANDQLTGRDNSGLADEAYEYDNNGNRLNKDGTTWSKDTDNRQTSDGTYTYTYDAEGNLTSRTLITGQTGVAYTQYDWDNRNRLVQITYKSSESGTVTGTISYRYDVYNERISVIGTGSVTTNQREVREGGNLVLITNAAGAVTSRFFTTPELNEVVAEETGGTTRWALTDHQGSVRDVTDNSGAVINHIVYDSFGNILSQTNSTNALKAGYTGQQWDGDASLWYYHARYFDAKLGRFISQDPKGFGSGDDNLYAYVGNNAINLTDPTGMMANEFKFSTSGLTLSPSYGNSHSLPAYNLGGSLSPGSSYDSPYSLPASSSFGTNGLTLGSHVGAPTIPSVATTLPVSQPKSLLVAVAGTSSRTSAPGSVYNFYNDYQGDKIFRYGPDAVATGSDALRTTNEIVRQVLAYHQNNPGAAIDLIGHSRGAVQVTDVARILSEGNIPVRYMGLYDPVDMSNQTGKRYDPAKGTYVDSQTIPASVRNVAVAVSDPSVLSRESWTRPSNMPENPTKTTVVKQNFFGTHGAIGGNPWQDEDDWSIVDFATAWYHPQLYQNSRLKNAGTETGASIMADTFVRTQAHNVGVPIKPASITPYGSWLIYNEQWEKLPQAAKNSVKKSERAASTQPIVRALGG